MHIPAGQMQTKMWIVITRTWTNDLVLQRQALYSVSYRNTIATFGATQRQSYTFLQTRRLFLTTLRFAMTTICKNNRWLMQTNMLNCHCPGLNQRPCAPKARTLLSELQKDKCNLWCYQETITYFLANKKINCSRGHLCLQRRQYAKTIHRSMNKKTI